MYPSLPHAHVTFEYLHLVTGNRFEHDIPTCQQEREEAVTLLSHLKTREMFTPQT